MDWGEMAGGADACLVASAVSRGERLQLRFSSASLFWPLRSKAAEPAATINHDFDWP